MDNKNAQGIQGSRYNQLSELLQESAKEFKLQKEECLSILEKIQSGITKYLGCNKFLVHPVNKTGENCFLDQAMFIKEGQNSSNRSWCACFKIKITTPINLPPVKEGRIRYGFNHKATQTTEVPIEVNQNLSDTNIEVSIGKKSFEINKDFLSIEDQMKTDNILSKIYDYIFEQLSNNCRNAYKPKHPREFGFVINESSK